MVPGNLSLVGVVFLLWISYCLIYRLATWEYNFSGFLLLQVANSLDAKVSHPHSLCGKGFSMCTGRLFVLSSLHVFLIDGRQCCCVYR